MDKVISHVTHIVFDIYGEPDIIDIKYVKSFDDYGCEVEVKLGAMVDGLSRGQIGNLIVYAETYDVQTANKIESEIITEEKDVLLSRLCYDTDGGGCDITLRFLKNV